MKLLISILLISLTVSCSSQGVIGVRGSRPAYAPPSDRGLFTFTLASDAVTSAGIFNPAGVLIRTLWNTVEYSAGSHTAYWDGRDDYNNLVATPGVRYTYKVLSNNVHASWEGVIGNTSEKDTGANIHNGYYFCMTGIAITTDTAYSVVGFQEGRPTRVKWALNNPNKRLGIYGERITTPQTDFVCTDNVRVYYGSLDAGSTTHSWVDAIDISTGQPHAFTVDTVTYTLAVYANQWKTISYRTDSKYISGMAVQKTGNLLFVAYSDANEVRVLNKLTGELLNTLTYTNPRGLSIDASDDLIMITGTNTVRHYDVNTGSNSLNTFDLAFTGTTAPLATQVSPDGATLVVIDGGNQQNLKAYSTSTGSSSWTLGTAGGYQTDATVSNSKFAFTVDRTSPAPAIAFQSNGSFWVTDIHNFRAQHYSSSRTYIDRIMSLPAVYHAWVDKNDITRLFSDFLEFQRDYGKPLSDDNGWSLVKSWGANIDGNYGRSIDDVTTLSNGKTYGLISHTGSYKAMVELVEGGTTRFTGDEYQYAPRLAKDGALLVSGDIETLGSDVMIYRNPLTGFDGSNNPDYAVGVGTAIATIQDLAVDSVAGRLFTGDIITEDSTVIIYNPDTYFAGNTALPYTGNHLGGIPYGGNTFKFTTERATHRDYSGRFPPAGWFDIGNGVSQFSGGSVNVVGPYIIPSYHGEFWKASQTNYFNIYHQSGLSVGQFGLSGVDSPLTRYAVAGLAGNATAVAAVLDQDTIRLWHSDESVHNGFSEWKVTGLETVQIQSGTLKYPAGYTTPSLGYTELMAGLPFNDTITTGTANWTRNYPDTTMGDNKFYVRTSSQKYQKYEAPDIAFTYRSDVITANLTRDLGTVDSEDWTLSGELIFYGSLPNNHTNRGIFFQVLDNADKVISSVAVYFNPSTSETAITGNEQILYSAPDADFYHPYKRLTPLSIRVQNGTDVTFSYGNYTPVYTDLSDVTADGSAPKKFRIIGIPESTGTAFFNRTLDLKDWKLYVQ